MEDNEKIIKRVALYTSHLTAEFISEKYGDNTFFFPDDVNARQAKFMLWLMKRYGVEDQYLNDLEQFELMVLLRKK